MTKSFWIIVEHDDKYSDADVLRDIMSNIDVDIYKELGIKFKIDEELKKRYNKLFK